jgi:hypothetical protein
MDHGDINSDLMGFNGDSVEYAMRYVITNNEFGAVI